MMARSFGFPVCGMCQLTRSLITAQVDRHREDMHELTLISASLGILSLRAFATIGAALGLLTMIVVTLMRLAIPFPNRTDPFSHWLEFSWNAFAASEMSCSPSVVDYAGGYCYFQPAEGPIAQINVRIANGRARQIQLVPHPSALTLGNLISLWGRPETEPLGA